MQESKKAAARGGPPKFTAKVRRGLGVLVKSVCNDPRDATSVGHSIIPRQPPREYADALAALVWMQHVGATEARGRADELERELGEEVAHAG